MNAIIGPELAVAMLVVAGVWCTIWALCGLSVHMMDEWKRRPIYWWTFTILGIVSSFAATACALSIPLIIRAEGW